MRGRFTEVHTQLTELLAPPILLFRAVPVVREGVTIHKGHLEFCGVAIIERLEMVVQRDPQGAGTFPNLVIDLVVIDVGWPKTKRSTGGGSMTGETRPGPQVNASGTHRQGGVSWVRDGRVALSRVRRRVLSSRVRTGPEQRPAPGSKEASTLSTIYEHFDGRKHAFEQLAATVASRVFERSGAKYHRGWLTRAGGDGGMDFVGRLDAGSPDANTPLVVLGQAKCVAPTSSISPDEVARIVARTATRLDRDFRDHRSLQQASPGGSHRR